MEGWFDGLLLERLKEFTIPILIVSSLLVLLSLIYSLRRIKLIQQIFGKARKEKDEDLMETWVTMDGPPGPGTSQFLGRNAGYPTTLPRNSDFQLRNLITEIELLKTAIQTLAESLGKGHQIHLGTPNARTVQQYLRNPSEFSVVQVFNLAGPYSQIF